MRIAPTSLDDAALIDVMSEQDNPLDASPRTSPTWFLGSDTFGFRRLSMRT